MKKITFLFLVSTLLVFSSRSYGNPVKVPDPILEAAIENKIGDNDIAGTVDGEWLLGNDSAAGTYTGTPGGLVVLGPEGENLFTVQGVTDLTGLEYAKKLDTLSLKASPVSSLLPLQHLESLNALAFDSCALNTTHLEELLEASFALSVFALINVSTDTALHNKVDAETLYAFAARHPALHRLALANLGLDFEIGSLAGSPQLADPPCRKDLCLAGSRSISLDGLASFYDAVLIDLSHCNITDEILAQGDWSKLACLNQALILSANGITNITPLLGLTAAERLPADNAPEGVVLDLRENRLDEQSINQHIPQLKSAGWDVRFNMELLLIVEGIGDLPPKAGYFWHPYGASVFSSAHPRPDSNQGFVGWRGDVVSDEYGVAVDMTSHRVLTAIFSEIPAPGRKFYALTIKAVGSGNGTVLPACGKSLYRDGEMIGLVATPDTDSYFGGWEITYEGTGDQDKRSPFASQPLQSVNMRSNVSATAHFDTAGFILTLALSGQGNLSLAPGQYPLVAGANIRLHAMPDPGWRLKQWEDGEGNVLFAPHGEEESSLEITLKKDRTIHAVFEEAIRTLTVRVHSVDGVSGDVVVDGKRDSVTGQYGYGDMATITAVPANKDVAFAGWSGDLPQGLSEEMLLAKTLSVSMEENRTITAGFVPAETHLIVDAIIDDKQDGMSSGMTPLPGVYGFLRKPECLVTLKALLLPGNAVAFAGWRGDLQDKAASANFTETVSMDRDRKITAVFQTQKTCNVEISFEGNGTVIPAPGIYTVVPGRIVTLKAQPQERFCFGGFYIRRQDGTDHFSLLPEMPLEISGDTKAAVRFGEPAHTLWIGASEEGGTLNPAAGVYSVPEGTVLDLEAAPSEGRMFYHWADSNGDVISREPKTRIEITANAAYNAVFGNPGYRVHVETAGTGAGHVRISPQSSGIYPPSSTVELTAMPDADSVFVSWEGLPFPVESLESTIKIILTKDVHLTAVFRKAECRLTVVAEGLEKGLEGLVRPEPGVYGYLNGMKAECFAAPPPDSGYVFAGWESDGINSIHPECAFMMNGDRQVTARFVSLDAVESVQLEVLPSQGLGSGILKPLSPGRYHFCPGTSINFFCELQQESFFDGFTGDYADNINYHHVPVVLDRNRSIGARFAAKGVVLVLGLDGEAGGMISPPPGNYRFGGNVDVMLQATRTDTHWSFIGWFDGFDNQLSSYGRYRFHLPSDKHEATIVAIFRYHPEIMPIEFCMAPSSAK